MTCAFRIFLALYLIALALLAVSVFGLAGQEKDPLGGVFLLPLGLPWNVLLDKIGAGGAAALALAPAINVALLYWLSRRGRITRTGSL